MLCSVLMAGTIPFAQADRAPTLAWRLLATHPHNPLSFTQGLVLDGDRLIEGTGLFGQSAIEIRDRQSLRLLRRRPLPAAQFGEGVAVLGERIFQLTWQSGVVHIYDRQLNPLRQARINGEGWGLTTDGSRLIRSDGSARLRFHDADTLSELGSIVVTDDGLPIRFLNELEFVDGLVFANVWQTDRIAVIDPVSGSVRGWLDLAALSGKFQLLPRPHANDAVLNGIAALPTPGQMLVTGKLWPLLFEIAVDMRPLEHR